MKTPHFIALGCTLALFGCPEPVDPCALSADEVAAITADGHTVARQWDEQALNAIRVDLPTPTVHARNLFHLSAAMFDAWAAYDATATGVFVQERVQADDVEAARREAMSYAAYRVLWQRYHKANRGAMVRGCLNDQMQRLGYDINVTRQDGTSPAAVGNRIAQAIIEAGLKDGSNEANGYADTTGFIATEPPLDLTLPGTQSTDGNTWQPLQFQQSFSQNGIDTGGGVQPYMGAHWREVKPFAMQRQGSSLYHDPGPAPRFTDPEMRRYIIDVLRRQAELGDDALVDISPGALGNNSLGHNDGTGHSINPTTGQPYLPQRVPRKDFGRVLAEFWADGPKSETPPGHWNVLANEVTEELGEQRLLFGTGAPVAALEWDVKLYLALNGALHDAAISAWEIKRATVTARPITLVRYAAFHSVDFTEPDLIKYGSEGLLVRAWAGEPASPSTQVGGVDWRPMSEWMPYQRKTFVTPAFPGFISGHSTFSRAAAEVLTGLTGSQYFPHGVHQFVARANAFLQFEDGPSTEVRLQWATYFDAADQAGQSRIWGGIHIEPDDFRGRVVGSAVGKDALTLARRHFDGAAP